MVRYVLRCDEAHKFQAWFRSAADFERAFAAGGTLCPVCEREADAEQSAGEPARRPREPAYQ